MFAKYRIVKNHHGRWNKGNVSNYARRQRKSPVLKKRHKMNDQYFPKSKLTIHTRIGTVFSYRRKKNWAYLVMHTNIMFTNGKKKLKKKNNTLSTVKRVYNIAKISLLNLVFKAGTYHINNQIWWLPRDFFYQNVQPSVRKLSSVKDHWFTSKITTKGTHRKAQRNFYKGRNYMFNTGQ